MKSIWDGWTKQTFHVATDDQGGFCARGWYILGGGRVSSAERNEAELRIGKYIQQNYELPDEYRHPNGGRLQFPKTVAAHAIIYANNELKLTPNDFRRIDIETQIAEGMPAVEKLVESVELEPVRA